MKTIIAGPRDFYDYDVVCEAIKQSGFDITEVVSGGATGVDRLGERWGQENIKKKSRIFDVEWDNFNLPGCIIKTGKGGHKYNATAGFHRNSLMADYAEALIAIVTGSPGTEDMVKKAKEKGLKVFEYNTQDNYKDEDIGYVF